MGSLDNAVARGRARLAAFMKDTAVIAIPPAPTASAYGEEVPGTGGSVTTVSCSIFPFLDRKEPEGIIAEKIQGRKAWTVLLPYGTAVDRTQTMTVTTQAGGTFNLQVLEVIEKQTRALLVKAICAELVGPPTGG